MGVQKEEITPASPPELPPILLSLFQMFTDLPYSQLLVYVVIVVCETLVLMKGIMPASLKQAIIPESFSFISWALLITPIVVLFPFWSNTSLTDVGIP